MRAIACLFVFIPCWAFGQDKATQPEFDIVDVKPNLSREAQVGSGSILPSGQFRAVNIPIKEIIKFAFNVRDEAIVGAPAWVDTEHYDIVGKAPVTGNEETFWRSTSVVQVMKFSYNWDDTFRMMVQSLLADRFKLAFHRDERPLNVFALIEAKGGAKLQKAADSGRPDCTRTVKPEVQAEAICKNMTMADLGHALQILAPGYADRTVVDLTGIQGTYDLQLDWVGRQVVDQGGLTMPGALEKQLGLKLDGRKLPVPVIVIDHIEKPSDN